MRQGGEASVILLAALALAFVWELGRSLREPVVAGRLVVCLLVEDESVAAEVCVADALRALEAVGPRLGAVVVAARPTRSAMLAALSRRHTGIAVAVTGDGWLELPAPHLTASLGPGFRAATLAARARAILSTAAAASPKRE